MFIRLDELNKSHELVKAAHAMVRSHLENDTALPALEDVHQQFPDVPSDYLLCLWVGINAKDRERLVES